MITPGHIQTERNPSRPAPPAVWAASLIQITENPPRRLPLKSHGYLKTIAYDLADTQDKENEKTKNRHQRGGSFQKPETSEPQRISSVRLKELIKKNYKNRPKKP